MPLNEKQKSILNFCLVPRTIADVAAEYSYGYHAARNDVMALCEQFLLKKSLRPKNRHFTFQTAFKQTDGGGIEHINFSFMKVPLSPVGVMNHKNFPVGVVRATRLIQLAIAKLLMEYDGDNKPGKEREEKFLPRSSMVKARVAKAAEYLREVADLADQVASSVAWGNKDFVRLFYGPDKYNREGLGLMMDELLSEAEKWPEFQEYLRKEM